MRKIRCTQKQLNEPRIVHSDNKSTDSVSPPPAEQPLILLLSSDDDETLDNGSTNSIPAPPEEQHLFHLHQQMMQLLHLIVTMMPIAVLLTLH